MRSSEEASAPAGEGRFVSSFASACCSPGLIALSFSLDAVDSAVRSLAFDNFPSSADRCVALAM